MGALLVFPSLYRDLSDDFAEWRQQTFRELPKNMQDIVTGHEHVWNKKVRDNVAKDPLVFDDLDEVCENVWIGSYNCARDEDLLQSHGIHNVLNMASECNYTFSARGMRLVKIGIDDGRLSNIGVFEKAAEVIADSVSYGEPIMVHCAAGVSRSVTAVVSYLMLYKQIGLRDAMVMIQSKRSVANPHPLLVRTLIRDFGEKFLP